ncbi:MAG: CPBP family intramembrane metalloprotease [Novosphingobium sp.]
MDGLISLGAILGLLLLAGCAAGLADRKHFAPRWLIAAMLLVAINDALLTGFYGALPQVAPQLQWNWQGKVLAMAATYAIALLPAFQWRKAGLTLKLIPGSLKSAIPVLALYGLFFLAISLAFPSGPGSAEDMAFQLTMPGFEEEPFYRGLLLLALDRAFTARVRFLGVDWGWGAIFSCTLFGLAHAFSYSDGHFAFEPLFMALTAFPAFIAVWLRVRTGSVLLPVIMHNFGNAIPLLV